MRLALALALYLLPFTAAPLRAQSVAVASDEQYGFARALADRGYFDLAREQFQLLIREAGTNKDLAASGQLGLARITQREADFLPLQERPAKMADFEEMAKGEG